MHRRHRGAARLRTLAEELMNRHTIADTIIGILFIITLVLMFFGVI